MSSMGDHISNIDLRVLKDLKTNKLAEANSILQLLGHPSAITLIDIYIPGISETNFPVSIDIQAVIIEALLQYRKKLEKEIQSL